MNISLIACIDKNGAIGYKNRLLTHIPNDLKRFKELTLNKYCIMGRKTYESILEINGEPLKNRHSIVLTGNRGYRIDENYLNKTTILSSIPELIKFIKDRQKYNLLNEELEFMVCGGSQIYESLIDYASKIYLTKIHHSFKKVDSFFPHIKKSEWSIVYDTHFTKDSKNSYSYSFINYERVK